MKTNSLLILLLLVLGFSAQGWAGERAEYKKDAEAANKGYFPPEWADGVDDEESGGGPDYDRIAEECARRTDKKFEAQEREQRSFPYHIINSTVSMPIEWGEPTTLHPGTDEWTVIKGSETFTLADFVASGKFCGIYGHQWKNDGDPCSLYAVWPGQSCPKYSCRICQRQRKKLREPQSELWEP